jgi:hypothetical protein
MDYYSLEIFGHGIELPVMVFVVTNRWEEILHIKFVAMIMIPYDFSFTCVAGVVNGLSLSNLKLNIFFAACHIDLYFMKQVT